MPNSLKCRLKNLAYQGLLSEKDLSRIYTDNDLNEYLRETVKNDEKCKNCMLKHEDNVCFFAYECIKNNHNHFKLEWKGENK